MSKIGRLLTAMVTPFKGNGDVDYEQAKKLALALLESGSDGVVVTGTTGESPTLDWDESICLYREIKSVVGDRGTVIAGTGSNDTHEAIEATKEAERMSVDACLLVVPYYNKPSQEGLYQHFKNIAESTGLPCILYNVPSRTITNLTPETVIKLSQIPNIVGIKEASGNMDQVAKIISGAKDDFLVWSGNDGDTFHVMALGGYGVISVASHLVGEQIKEMVKLMDSGYTKSAARIHRYLLPLVNALFLVSNPVPVKYALNRVGFRVGKPRLPLVEPDEKTASQIWSIVKKYKIDLPTKKV